MAAAVRSSPVDSMAQSSNKRKRGNEDMGRNIKDNKPANTEDDYALLQATVNLDSQRAAQDALNVPFPESNVFDAGLDANFAGTSPTQSMGNPQHGLYAAGNSSDGAKPGVGTPEWHKARKDSHKEVERRRREVINEGIENIAKLVASGDKNKGAILQRTHGYILELQEKEKKFAEERQLLHVTIDELTKRNESLRNSNRQAWNESNKWQDRCRELGGDFDDYDSHGPQIDDIEEMDPSLAPS